MLFSHVTVERKFKYIFTDWKLFWHPFLRWIDLDNYSYYSRSTQCFSCLFVYYFTSEACQWKKPKNFRTIYKVIRYSDSRICSQCIINYNLFCRFVGKDLQPQLCACLIICYSLCPQNTNERRKKLIWALSVLLKIHCFLVKNT